MLPELLLYDDLNIIKVSKAFKGTRAVIALTS